MIDTYIHPTAVIDNGAIIGNGCHIWHFVHIMEGAVLGNSCNIGQNVMIAGSAIIGNNVKIGAGAVVIEDVPDNCTVVGPKAKVILREL